MRRLLLATLAAVAAVGLAACVGSTEPATNVTNNSAQLNARGYTDDGPATWWWEYDTVQADLGTLNDTEVCGNPPELDNRCGPASGGSQSNQVPLSVTVRGLDPSTTYYFRACGQDENDSGPTCAQTRSFTTLPGTSFDYTGASRTWTVPAGVTSVTFDVFGAQGGGLGGEARATIAVSPGQILQLNVGGQDGFNGGGSGGRYGESGGGGASDVRVSPFGLADRIIIAGGGGGSGQGGLLPGGFGGAGGGLSGEPGRPGPLGADGGPGLGGTATGGGTGGHGGSGGRNGTDGSLGDGGRGGDGPCPEPFCGGGGGGGGGGLYGGGGGGGGEAAGGSGGGGSGFGPAGVVFSTGVQVGNGRIVLSY
jgi:hypothetical protein